MSARRSLVVAALAAFTGLAGGCALPEPPPDPPLRADELPPAERIHAVVEIDSPGLTGTFDAILVRTFDPILAARLQLFGSPGGKVLDLSVTEEALAGYLPQAGVALAAPTPYHDAPPPHLFTFLAASILERDEQVDRERIVAWRSYVDGWEVELVPSVAGCRVWTWIDEDGLPRERRYRAHTAEWKERLGEDRAFTAPDFDLRVLEARTEAIEPPPLELYRLVVPQGMSPADTGP
jgi:hypothetical protein